MPNLACSSALSTSVSIVIATAGRAESLDRTLLSLRQLRYPLFEVIVVLGPSSDYSAQVVARHAEFVRLGTIDRLNLSAARNIGVSMARGDIVAFIDDDAIPEPDWLEQLLTGYDDPDVAQVGGFIRDNRGVGFQATYLVVDRFGDSMERKVCPEDLDDDRFLALTGTNFSVRRNRLLAVGGFDEEYAYFLDETDVTVRLHDRGWASAVVPAAEIHHKYEASHMRTETRVPRTMYPTARSKAYFCCVHAGRKRPLHEVMDYLAEFIRKERAWKSGLVRHGHADQAAVDRLIEEVERGVRDGVRDAFFYSGPQGLIADHPSSFADDPSQFHRFILPLPAKDRLRLCLLSQDYPPVGNGGIGQWTRELAIGLAARGHEVTVICRSETDYPYIDFIEGVWVHRIVGRSSSSEQAARDDVPLSLLNYSTSVVTEIERIQDRRQFDVICGPIFDLEPLSALRSLNIPTVVSLQTTYKLALPHKPDWLGDAWYRKSHVDKVIAKEKELLETAPRILANTRALLSDLEAGYEVLLTPDRVTIIHHGIEDLALGVEPFPAKPGVVRLLFVGRLELRKGADLLFEALPGLLRDYPQLEVDIVGDDGQEIDGETLRCRYEARWRKAGLDTERVVFHGAIPREDLLRHYASCDIFVAPSRYESFGLIYVEAMTFAKPVVGLAVGGVVDVVQHGINGLLVESEDPFLLGEAIATLINDPSARKEMGRAGRKLYEQKFNMETMVEAAEEYFKDVACT